jgi:triacylglycerol lipase
MIVFAICVAVLGALLLLDLGKKIDLLRPLPLTLYLPAAANPILLGYWFYQLNPAGLSVPLRIVGMVLAGAGMLYLWVRLNVVPRRDFRAGTRLRLRIMMGGRFLVFAGLWALALETAVLIAAFFLLRGRDIPRRVFIGNAVYGMSAAFFILWNGMVRIFCTSRRLSVFWRLLILLTVWIPPLQFLVLLYACRLIYEEYDFALHKENLQLTRVDSAVCQTRYPLILVHGVLFRDLKYFNYWGRIPRELIRNGAKIWYGSQEAVGTVATNAEDIRKKIAEVIEETGAEKVNIIAHSKGGLDARYAINLPGVAERVASLTTIGTPHRGCRFVDLACRLPEGLYRLVANCVDRVFSKIGDQRPDFYQATRQFATGASEEFNRRCPDSPGVYYQSYMSRMKSARGDPLLALPYALIRPLEGDNDGLVSVSSARWGTFRGTFESGSRRGISHGDIIDLKREDYRGFDVVETYVQIVADLKAMGF